MKFYVRGVLKTTPIEAVRNKLESTGVTQAQLNSLNEPASIFPTSLRKFLEISLDVPTANRVDKELKSDRSLGWFLSVSAPRGPQRLHRYPAYRTAAPYGGHSLPRTFAQALTSNGKHTNQWQQPRNISGNFRLGQIPPLMSLKLEHGTSGVDPSHQFRGNIVNAFELDIVCVTETFLLKEQIIELPEYRWIGNNRKHISKRAWRGSGGVGILIKLSLLCSFDVAVISDKFEGILWVQFIHKDTKSSFSVCVCYLPPIGSSRGDQSLEFLDSLKSLVIDNYHSGDFLMTLMLDVVTWMT